MLVTLYLYMHTKCCLLHWCRQFVIKIFLKHCCIFVYIFYAVCNYFLFTFDPFILFILTVMTIKPTLLYFLQFAFSVLKMDIYDVRSDLKNEIQWKQTAYIAKNEIWNGTEVFMYLEEKIMHKNMKCKKFFSLLL